MPLNQSSWFQTNDDETNIITLEMYVDMIGQKTPRGDYIYLI